MGSVDKVGTARPDLESWKSSLHQLTWFAARGRLGLAVDDEPKSEFMALMKGIDEQDSLVQRLFLARISELQACAAAMQEAIEQSVVEAAKVGVNYTQLGTALGVSKQAARKQYHDLVEAVRHSDTHLDNLPLEEPGGACEGKSDMTDGKRCPETPEVLLVGMSGWTLWSCVDHAAGRLATAGYLAAEGRKGAAREVVERSRALWREAHSRATAR
ncbi:hypothetical protein ACQPZF_37950 [Actinosynnema sp. CS-041913]|uniref:hypothetical protein n=1 Tax=Actinosynnema sp. CS-041913 TaxID=3239917 RepID=UPI003D9014C4